MSNNGMNYPMYNTMPYSQTVQQQPYSEQRSENPYPQAPMSGYDGYQIYPPMHNQPQYSSYDQLLQSAAETLAAFTHPSELSLSANHHARALQKNASRRSFNHSAGATTNSPAIFYCETCRIACGGPSSYQAHLNGSKHRKKESSSHNQQTSPSTLRCELCDIVCSNSDAYKAHLDGSKHEKAMKLYRKLGKTIPDTSPVITSESQTVGTSEEPTLTRNPSEFIGEEYIETSYDDTNAPKSYYCKLCDCKFHDSNGRDAHLKGKRHRQSYKKKVDPNFQLDGNNNHLPSLKQHNHDEPVHYNSNHQTERDDDTKCLMSLHERIIPTQNLLDVIEQFVSAAENALKLCSDQLRSSVVVDPSKTTTHSSSLLGISRIGPLVKKLLVKSDRTFQIVVVCAEWPTMNLLEKISSLLLNNFHDAWKNRIEIRQRNDEELIRVSTDTEEGQMFVEISLASMTMLQQETVGTSEQLLSKDRCFHALSAMHSVRWFQHQVSKRQYASALVRCLRYKTTVSWNWKSFSSEAIEILVDHALTKSNSAVCAFRRVLEYLAGGLILKNGPGLRIPWQNDVIRDVLENLNDQERNSITDEAQVGLRLLAFGQLNKWLEQHDHPEEASLLEKRSYPGDENEAPAKRRCTE